MFHCFLRDSNKFPNLRLAIEAINIGGTAPAVLNAANEVSELPAGTDYGINYNDDNSVTLALMAPKKNYIYVVGDFNDWKMNSDHRMNVTPNDSG